MVSSRFDPKGIGSRSRRPSGAGTGGARLVREPLAHGGVEPGVTQFRHGSGFDLADPFPGEIEVRADLIEGARLPAVEAETQRQDFALARREGDEQLGDLAR